MLHSSNTALIFTIICLLGGQADGSSRCLPCCRRQKGLSPQTSKTVTVQPSQPKSHRPSVQSPVANTTPAVFELEVQRIRNLKQQQVADGVAVSNDPLSLTI